MDDSSEFIVNFYELKIEELKQEIAMKELEASMNKTTSDLSYLLRSAPIPSTTHFGPILPWIPCGF